MKYFVSALIFATGLSSNVALAADGGIKAGVLTCKMDGIMNAVVYTKEEFACVFKPNEGADQNYKAVLKEFGVNLSFTKENELVWGVLAPSGNMMSPELLRGTYVGGTGQVEIGAGVSANILVGGGDNSITLQPLSVSGMLGAGAALDISALELR